METGTKCTVNGKHDLAMIGEARPFIDQPCLIVKKCKSGLIQVCLADDPSKVCSVPQRNITIT